ncbi:hypothetical protein [uncultured Draconibacterium sp.]|uniref:Spy/CpxP family protein refolding chaperone n=1 Tax=uncultured Draconibacterium sp. TaxID=1573823 RepID=UPI003217318B
MANRNTYRILIWVIVILVATNLSMALSFWYHKQQDKKDLESTSEQTVMPSEQRTRFFRDELDLNLTQVDQFRDLNREYNRNARLISNQLENLRVQMVSEMAKEEPSKQILNSIAEEIGENHSELKQLTVSYYLGMKDVCDSVQQKKLKEIFLTVSKAKEDVSLPKRGRGFRGGGGPRN